MPTDDPSHNSGVAPTGSEMQPQPTADEALDAIGLRCPEPLMLTRNKIRNMKSGEVLQVLSSDPTTERDLLNFCRFMGHEMMLHRQEERENGRQWSFWIRKA